MNKRAKGTVLSLSIITSLLSLILFNCKSDEYSGEAGPNIIYILADDLGYGDISCYNPNSQISTPNIDSLAAKGIRFTDAHTTSSVCTPTRYGILTGRYNWRSILKAGVLTGKSKALIPRNRKTVAGLLDKYGYFTSFIGKWHLGWDWALKGDSEFGGPGWLLEDFANIDFSKRIRNGPTELGFDDSFGHSGSLDMAPYVYVHNDKVTRQPDRITSNDQKYSWWRPGPTAPDFIHEEVTPKFFDRAISTIEQEAQKEHPFFIFLALPSPHTPILPGENWKGKSNLNPYADLVLMIDDYLGQVVQTLDRLNITENTMIIFTSDNGCSPEADFDLLRSNGHDPSAGFRGHKADIFEGGHRVPFIVKWPERINKPTTSNALISTSDFYATCADLMDVALAKDEGEDSFSFLPILTSNTSESLRKDIVHHSIDGSFAIRKGPWKLIFTGSSGGWSDPRPEDTAALDTLLTQQLYNLVDDPGEQSNVLETHPEIVKDLTELMKAHINNGRSTPGPKVENDKYPFEWKQVDAIFEEKTVAF